MEHFKGAYDKDKQIYEEVSRKYVALTQEALLVEHDQKKLAARHENLLGQLQQTKQANEEILKDKESIFFIKKI